MENTDDKTNVTPDFILDNKKNIKVETEENRVAEIDEIHIKVECQEEIEDHTDSESSRDRALEIDKNYEDAGSSTSVTCSSYCEDADTFKEHPKSNSGCKQIDNGHQSVAIKGAIERYTCDICNKSYTQKSTLNSHKRMHTGEKPHSCDICNKSFFIKGSLEIHKQQHAGVKSYSCDVCKRSFLYKGSLHYHKSTHVGKKPYSCDVCNKSFTKKSSLISHKQLHTGVKPYSCDICNKSFPHKSYLNKHKHKLKHAAEKTHSCDICDKSFPYKNYLNSHKCSHS